MHTEGEAEARGSVQQAHLPALWSPAQLETAQRPRQQANRLVQCPLGSENRSLFDVGSELRGRCPVHSWYGVHHWGCLLPVDRDLASEQKATPGSLNFPRKGLLRQRARVSPEDSTILGAEPHLGFLLTSSAESGESQEKEGLGYFRSHTDA